MALTDEDVAAAEGRMSALREAGHAVAARYDRRHRHLTVTLHSGVRLVVPVRLIQGLADAPARCLGEIEISPSGLGLHWPQLDADVYVPALLRGVFGTEGWMARLGSGSHPDEAAGRRSA